MTPLGRALISEVAELRGLDPSMITGRRRFAPLVRARIDIAKRLDAAGYNTVRIGAVLNKDHSTICFYLGTVARQQPAAMRWRKPFIKHLKCQKCSRCYFPLPRPTLPLMMAKRQRRGVRYLVPFVGAERRRIYHG